MSGVVKRILLTLASGAYLASPLDVIPDVIPLFGLTDDTAFILLAAFSWYTMYRKRKVEESTAGQTIIDVEPAEVDIP